MNTTSPRVSTTKAGPVTPGSAAWGLEFLGTLDPSDELPQPWVRIELCFALPGLGNSSGEDAWSGFLDEEVTPAFPDGWSVVRSFGQWRNRAGRLERAVTPILLIVARDSQATHQRLKRLTAAWKERTGEESVLRVITPATVSF